MQRQSFLEQSIKLVKKEWKEEQPAAVDGLNYSDDGFTVIESLSIF